MGAPMTGKQRKRDRDAKERLQRNRKLKKAMRGKTRRYNRNDEQRLSTKTIDELKRDVADSVALPCTDVLDPRALTNLLVAKDVETGKVALTSDAPSAIFEQAATDVKNSNQAEDDEASNEPGSSQNRYNKKGPAFAWWRKCGLHPSLIAALNDLKFTHPTPIQEEVLPFAIEQSTRRSNTKDVVVSAETGSGKTLIFALPILHGLLSEHRPRKRARTASGTEEETKEQDCETTEVAEDAETDAEPRLLYSLVLTPTRELAVQIDSCFRQLTRSSPFVRVACIVGGMAPIRQQRILNKCPHILICTPGRVWDLVQQNEGAFLGFSISRCLRCLVLDEADKLLQSGRFEELKKILARLRAEVIPSGPREDDDAGVTAGHIDPITGDFVEDAPVATVASFVKKDAPIRMTPPSFPDAKQRMIVYVTSATLSLEINYTQRSFGKKQFIRTTNADTMSNVLKELNMDEKQSKLFGLDQVVGVVGKLHETWLRCPEGTKDLYLYYFLRHHKEKTIVFVNAISMLRRLAKLLEVLSIPVAALHASMQQRQRLKYIEKFVSGERTVLIATDVASRGLDVEGVRHIVHFQVPRSTDAYIHRCGRTARCGGTGLSVVFVDPAEHIAFQKLVSSRKNPIPMELFAINQVSIHSLVEHLKIAHQIDKLQKEVSKSSADERWVSHMSKATEIDAEDMIDDDLQQQNQEKAKAMRILRKRLDTLIHRDVGVSHLGAFPSSAKSLGTAEASKKILRRAAQQTYAGNQY